MFALHACKSSLALKCDNLHLSTYIRYYNKHASGSTKSPIIDLPPLTQRLHVSHQIL